MSSIVKQPRRIVLPKALHLLEILRPFCIRIELAGSLRRETPIVGDIEIVAIPKRPVDLFGTPLKTHTALDKFLDRHGMAFGKRGESYQQFTYGSNKVDLFLPTIETWGCIFAIRTGSWEFSRWLVTSQAAGGATPEGFIFRDGRLYAQGRLLTTPEEADVFAALGLAYIPPRQRLRPPVDPVRVVCILNYVEDVAPAG